MKIIADLHIHSRYSRATSKKLDFEHLSQWAQMKGVNLLGTGDISHPAWLEEMRQKLQPAEDGLFKLKDEYARAVQTRVPAASQAAVRFMLAGEISSIYKKNDRVRKVHNVIFAPSLEDVAKIQTALEKIGNIRSDGRPILGLDSRDLLEIILDINPQNHLIPAHIWTPWFSMLGSKSGFDSVEECFDDLTPHIFALETGLSSDPPMNWRVSNLDRYTLVSNSDAHSPQKLAREANIFDTEPSYGAIFDALKTGDPAEFLGTLEFFPEEGKYHLDGHRKCNLRWTPAETLAHNGLCAVCGKPVTVGVMHRVEMLADRPEGGKPERTHPFQSLIPLPEILSEVHGVGPNSKRVQKNYKDLLARLGSELFILLDAPLEDIENAGGSLLAEGIRRMRARQVILAPGYDGEFGVVKVFDEGERSAFSGQLRMFAVAKSKKEKSRELQVPASDSLPPAGGEISPPPLTRTPAHPLTGPTAQPLNPQQQAAVHTTDAPLIIVAGPGTGKTRTLTHRVAHLIRDKDVAPERILAITFTNKAAAEMAERLSALLGEKIAAQLSIKTFHAFGAMVLRTNGERIGLSPDFAIPDEADSLLLLKQACPHLSQREASERMGKWANGGWANDAPRTTHYASQMTNDKGQGTNDCFQAYQNALRQNNALDFDDLIRQTIALFENSPETLTTYQQRFQWISVDEYQDINRGQYRLLQLLTAKGANLCVIGDPNQAIYGFRGAKRAYFLRFQQDFPKAKTHFLTQNYRSTQNIVRASTQVIVAGAEAQGLQLRANKQTPLKLDIHHAPTEKAEAEYVVHQIERMVGGTSSFSLNSNRVDDRVDDSAPAIRPFNHFAVLYRLKAQSQALIEAFERSGMPYQVIGQKSLYEYKEVKGTLAYLWLLRGGQSVFHLNQALTLGGSPVKLKDEGGGMKDEFASSFVLRFRSALTASQRKRLEEVSLLLAQLKTMRRAQPVSHLIERIHSHFSAGLNQKQSERLQQLAQRAAPFDARLNDFLDAAALRHETDAYDPRADRVTLMTLHASKGLEFPVVFIVGCEEGVLPYQKAGTAYGAGGVGGVSPLSSSRHTRKAIPEGVTEKSPDPEEERRLFYVGMTRAQEKLILTRSKKRFLFGKGLKNAPSRFLDDIENTLMELQKMPGKPRKPKPAGQQLKLFDLCS